MKRIIWLLLPLMLLPALAGGCAPEEPAGLTAFVGSASKPVMEEAAAAFERQTGVRVYLNFGGSGTMLSQLELARSGDLYIPGSPDFMAKAEQAGVVDPATVRRFAYLVPVIAVPRGNPMNINSLADLARPGLRVGIANPEAVCVGLYAIEMLDYNRLLPEVGRNIVTYAESCSKTATLVALKSVDAVIGWDVFGSWNPDAVAVVFPQPEQLPRLAYIPGAVATFTRDRENAVKFLDFLGSAEGQAIFRRHGYITTEAGARKYAPAAEIGGEYRLPAGYQELIGAGS